MSNFLIQTWVHSCYLHLQSLTDSPWKWCLEDDPLLSGRKIFNRGGKIVPISTCDVYAKYRYVSIFLQMCVKTDMQRHVFIWSIYLYCWVYVRMYICTWYWCTQCKSKQYTVYTHMYILYKYTYIYIYCLWLYYNTAPMITQAPWLVQTAWPWPRNGDCSRGPNVHEQQRRHSCTASMLQNANLGWWQPDFR